MKSTSLAFLLIAVIASGCVPHSDSADQERSNDAGSIDIRSAKAGPNWMEFGADDHGFKTRFPVAPKREALDLPSPLGVMPGVTWMAEANDEAFVVTVLTVPEAMLADFNVEGALDGGRDGMINNVGGTIVAERQTDFAGHKARSIVATVPNPAGEFELEARLLWVSPRLYQLIAVVASGSNSRSAQRFFDGFELTGAAEGSRDTSR